MLNRGLTQFLLLVFVSLQIYACAYTGSYEGKKAGYESYLEGRLKEERLFVRGEQRLSMKVIVADEAMWKMQSEVAPGFEFPYKEDKRQLVVAVSSQNRIPFLRDELKFILGDRKAVNVDELTSNFTIQTLYPYAFPYYRVFLVDFTGLSDEEEVFQMQTARGSLSVKLQFRPASQNRVD